MVNVHCLNNIASVGLDLFSDDYNMESSYEDAQAVLVRSAKMHDMELNDHLLAIARAGAGVNNIPLDKCAEAGIVVFNTPGANANAVKEQVLAAMLLASRDLIGGNQWVAENKDNAALKPLIPNLESLGVINTTSFFNKSTTVSLSTRFSSTNVSMLDVAAEKNTSASNPDSICCCKSPELAYVPSTVISGFSFSNNGISSLSNVA